MGVSVYQAGCCGVAVEIDGACGWRGEGLDFGIGAYFEDDAVADGEGLGDGVLGVYGEDVAVDEDEVGRRGLRVRDRRG